MAEYKFNIEFSPKIIILLGEELIHDHKIAISELVKNAYDADANNVTISISNERIIIEDDGVGMNLETIENIWLKPGVSSKKKDNTGRTPKYNRLPLGEKGIGRLGIHRLGNKVQVFSKTKHDFEVHFSIDWRLFEESESLEKMQPIIVKENIDSSIFTHGTGTKMIIEDLKKVFSDNDIKNVSNDLQKLQSPFYSIENFKVELYHQNKLFESQKIIDIKSIKEKAFFQFDISFRKNKIFHFEYKFLTQPHHKIPKRTLFFSDLKKIAGLGTYFTNTIEDLDLDLDLDIGKVRFRGFIYEYGLAKLLQAPLENIIKDYLKVNGGIRIYRDGMRIYNYGEEGKDNDILDLDKKRSKKLGDNIGFNQILASVDLERENSYILIEKTNREGFIHNDAFEYLRKALNAALELVVKLRIDDREKIKLAYEGKIIDRGNVEHKLKNIVKELENSGIADDKKRKIINKLQSFANEIERLKTVFLQATSTGLNLTFVIHEIDKIIDTLEQQLKNKNYEVANKIFLHLKAIVSAYKQTIQIDKQASIHNISEIIKQSIHNFQYRFNSHQITVEKHIPTDLSIRGKKNLIIGMFTNFFDNAIYWLKYYKIENRKIFIKAYEVADTINIIVVDNGKGFNISFESAKEPFISGRFDEGGMGIGLHLVEQIMLAHDGQFVESIVEDEKLLSDYKHGTVLKLIFKKG